MEQVDTQSSDDEDAAAELEEVLKWQREKSKDLRPEDFGLGDASEDETDREPTFEEILDSGKQSSKASLDKGIKDEDEKPYVRIEKDVNALTKEEQMDIVYRMDLIREARWISQLVNRWMSHNITFLRHSSLNKRMLFETATGYPNW